MALLFLLLFFVVPSYGDDDKPATGGIIESRGYAFFVSAPKNWAIDFETGMQNGVAAVFYPEEYNWADALCVFYANTTLLNDSTQRDINDVIDIDTRRIRKLSPEAEIKFGSTLNTGKARNAAITQYVMGDRFGNYEAVAYIQEEDLVVILAMSARNFQIFEHHFPDFVYFVESYYFLGPEEKVVDD